MTRTSQPPRHRLRPVSGVLASLLIAFGALLGTGVPAAAKPSSQVVTPAAVDGLTGPQPLIASNCSHGIRRATGNLFYAWAVCKSGSGSYRVGFACTYFTGTTDWIWGPTKKVGQGESRSQCPAHIRPDITTVQSWS